jgi:hypothetical protein
MFRRLPTFMASSFAATVGLFILTSVLTAQPPVPPPVPGFNPVPIDPNAIKRNEEQTRKLFLQFQDQVLRLAQRWEKSDNADDKERAKSLRAVLKLIEEKGVEKMFNELIDGISKKTPTTGDFNVWLGKDKKLMEALEQILAVLETEDELTRLKLEIEELKKQIEAVQKLKRDQENLRARTDNNGDPDKLAKAQKDLAQKTQDTANALDKANNKDGKDNNANGNPNGNKQDPKSEPKPETKPGDNPGMNKPDTNENKADTKNDGMGSPMGGDPKAGEPKPGDPKGMPMGGDPKGDKPSDPKAGGDPKGGDPKAGEPKAGPPMGDPMKPMGNDPMKPNGSEAKPSDSKSQGEGKGDSKPSAGQPGEGKPMGGDGMPMPGMGQPSPGGSKPSGGQQNPGAQQPKKDPAADQVQQAVPQQQGAEDDIKKDNKPEASKKQDIAIDKLQKALDELEKRLKQLREKELAKLLQNLEERVNRMLRMQIEVKAGTEAIDKTVKALGGKPASAEIQKSQAEADKESLIVIEADKALKLMEGEGTAVVFAGVLQQVKGDMEAIQKRLNEARVGEDTQQIEQDVIDQLKMMLEALKKAKQDLENKPSDPKPSDPNAKKQDQKLIDLLNELKLVKAMQEQLNKRTIMYNKQDPGEQSKDPLIQNELKQLSDRQKVLQDMIHKIATAANQ